MWGFCGELEIDFFRLALVRYFGRHREMDLAARGVEAAHVPSPLWGW